LLLTGTASCSARGCHGSLTPAAENPVQFDEYTRWQRHDPHTRAYQVLFSDRSKEIVKRLNLDAAPEEPRCLACHVNPLVAGPKGERLLREAPDGEPARRLRGEH